MSRGPKLAKLSRTKTSAQWSELQRRLGIELPTVDEVRPQGPLADAIDTSIGRVGNRFAILPMEGWDAEPTGHPTDLVERRWRRFGESGAKLIWGGEAVAVRPDGRANANQLMLSSDTASAIEGLRRALVRSHEQGAGSTEGLVVGLQLTHSGRFARPLGEPAPRTAFEHPVLDSRVGATKASVLSDSEIEDLVATYVSAASLAGEMGFDFVDIKHCHGYLLHELLSARTRPGPYGGELSNRTRFLREVVAGVRSEAPGLGIGVRLSIFDFGPYRSGADGIGEREASETIPFGSSDAENIDLSDADALLTLLGELEIDLVCTSAGSPYYNPHIQRPAFYPPSDGYGPPEDPLVGVHRQIHATAQLKKRHPRLKFVGSAYSYLQEWFGHVAEGAVETGATDFVGLGRMAISYPTLPRDLLEGRAMDRRSICRTFSDCTTAPRNGMISGCYPLDPFYKKRPEAAQLAAIVARTR